MAEGGSPWSSLHEVGGGGKASVDSSAVESPEDSPEDSPADGPADGPVDSGVLRRRKQHLRALGADAEHLSAKWLEMQAMADQQERMRRTTGLVSTENVLLEAATAKNAARATFGAVSPRDTGAAPHGHEHDAVWHPPHHAFTDEERLLMNHYESLDYDVVNSEALLRARQGRTYWTVKCDWIARWFVFGLIGALTGALAAAVAVAVEAVQEFKYGTALDILKESGAGPAFGFFVGVSCAFALVAVLLVVGIEPVAAGSGIPQLKAYLNGTAYMRLLQVKTLVVKLIGVIFSVTGGLIIGKEGPMVHSGAVLGANISHLTGCRRWFGHTRWLYRFRNDRDKRDFVSGGTAAGVAAAFGAPIGGVLFALEEAASHWSISLTWSEFEFKLCGCGAVVWFYIGYRVCMMVLTGFFPPGFLFVVAGSGLGLAEGHHPSS